MTKFRINPYLFLGLLCILLSIVAWLVGFINYYQASPERPFQIMASLGDSLGGITAPFLNIAGFLMVYAAFRQQNQALARSREEFALQRFESTFFQLLQMHYQNLDNIRNQYDKKAHEDFFEHARTFLKGYVTRPDSEEEMRRSYQKLYQDNYHLIDHFVRHLLFLLQSIRMSSAFEHLPLAQQQTERQQYAEMLRTQLSPDEGFLLFYHLLFQDASEVATFLPLIRHFDWFAHAALPNWLLHEAHWHWMQERLTPS